MEILTEDELAKLLPLSVPLADSDPPAEYLPSISPDVEDTGAECSFCGWCENPEQCVWSVTCTLCDMPPREHCVHPENRAMTSLHEERWKVVKQLYGVYYVTH